MLTRLLAAGLLAAAISPAVIIDRIAVVAGNSIVKDSDISREIRVTDFLNQEPLAFSEKARREAANRLVDQIFIRKEIQAGDYARATPEQAAAQLDALEKKRFASDAALKAAAARYGLTTEDLREHLQWQLTVLSFIDARFRPAVYISDQDVQQYYDQHAAQLKRQYPGRTTAAELRPEITNILAGERVNEIFFKWLDQQRKSTDVQYLEANLR